MIVIVPTTITSEKIKSYNIPDSETSASPYNEDTLYLAGERCTYNNSIYQAIVGDALGDAAAWSGTTAYVAGNRCYVDATHFIYQANSDTTNEYPPNYITGDSPKWNKVGYVNRGVAVSNTDFWVKVSSTNYWGMFDEYTDTQTVGIAATGGGYEIAVEIDASKCNAVSLFNLSGDRVELSLWRDDEQLWSQTTELVQRNSKTYSDYFFGRNIKVLSSFFTKFPAYFSTTLRVKVVGEASAKCGMVNIGYLKSIAVTNYGVSLSIIDYSSVETNAFGVTTITKRKTKKKHSLPMRILTKNLDEFYRFFESIPSTPCTFICDNDGEYQCMTVYGIYENFSVTVHGPRICDCSLDIRGIN